MTDIENRKMLDSKYNSTFCIKPFTEICNTANGGLKLCCQASKTTVPPSELNGSLAETFHTNANMIEIRRQMQAGERVDACLKCYRWEKSTGTSPRHMYNMQMLEYDPEIIDNAYTQPGYTQVKTLDIKFGNKCNLACVMCDPTNSSLIALERTKNNLPKSLDDSKMTNGKHIKQTHIEFSDDEFENIKKLAPSIISIKSTGGEPMLLPGFGKLLEYLVENGYSKNIDFRTVTNGTVDSTQWLHLMNQFKQFKIAWSIDAVGESYNYIRWPGKWSSVSEKHKRVMQSIQENNYKNIIINFSIAISVFNVHQCGDIIRYAHKLGINGSCDFNTVEDPEIMQPGLVSEQQMKDAIDDMLAASNDWQDAYPENDDFINYEVEGFANMLSDNSEHNHNDPQRVQQRLKLLKEITKYWQDVRKVSVSDYISNWDLTIGQLQDED